MNDNIYADMGEPPTAKHSIDRKDNDGPYSKDNCKWSTATEQANNRRSSVAVEYRGEAFTLATLAKNLGKKYDSLYHLYKTRKLPLEEAIARAKNL